MHGRIQCRRAPHHEHEPAQCCPARSPGAPGATGASGASGAPAELEGIHAFQTQLEDKVRKARNPKTFRRDAEAYRKCIELRDAQTSAGSFEPSLTAEEQMRVVDAQVGEVEGVLDPWGIWLGGGAGSGKGHVWRWLVQGGYISDQRFAHLDVDAQRGHLPRWQADPGKPKSLDTVQATQGEAGLLVDLAMARCASLRKGFVNDGTLRNWKHTLENMRKMRGLSGEWDTNGQLSSVFQHMRPLRIAVVFVDCPPDVCQRRARLRAMATGRPVQSEFVEISNTKARESAAVLSSHVELLVRVVNESDTGAPRFERPEMGDLLRAFTKSAGANSLRERHVSQILDRHHMELPAAYCIDKEGLVVHDKLGSGVIGEVFRGVWKGRPVAVKQIYVMGKDAGLEAQRQLAFAREVAVLSLVSHENLVKFLGVTSSTRPLSIVMELCQGGCLFELLHNQDDIDLNWGQQLKMCLDIARAMECLHACEPLILHRDLKSLNCLLARPVLSAKDTPVVKVSDFGLARVIHRSDDCEWGKMTIAAGTVHWMAPEVFTGHYDERADVYSYAMVLFEIICREIPFEDVEPTSVPDRVSAGERPDMEAVPPDRPAPLEALMVSCWAQRPGDRPPFCRIRAALEEIPVP